MNEDPFHEVKDEVIQQTTTLKTLFTRWKQLMANPSSKKEDDEFGWTTNEIQSISQNISWDLADLSETVRIVESNRMKFRISDAEFKTRKQFIESTKSDLEMIKREIQSPQARAMVTRSHRSSLLSGGNSSRLEQEIQMDNDNFIQGQLLATREMEQEQEIYLDQISQSVGTIGQIGHEMEEEIERQNVIIVELGKMAEGTGERIRRTMKDIDKFIDESNNSVSWTIIGLLVLIVFGLLMAVIYL